ncbi:hypothetical protein TRIUR3_28616 [Triticum urartu]|uniref:Uncharacterized protein n=1 Tax=Triticum urartu TaxID=4572 RepID=M7ZSZ1_TRIUA|nr:hypothetical protein TRIUR3_28616 [Triticum urartu]
MLFPDDNSAIAIVIGRDGRRPLGEHQSSAQGAPVKSKFAESKLPKFKFLPEHRSPKPQVNRLISKYIDYLNTIQAKREDTFNTLQDQNMSKESLANASKTMNKKLHAMVKSAKEDLSEIVKLGGNALAVPARFDTDVKAPPRG